MKASIASAAGLAMATLVLLSTLSCSQDKGMATASPSAPGFQSSDEAAAQGKRDLMEVLRINPEVKLGVDPGLVERSTPGPALNIIEVDFRSLLAAGAADHLQQLDGTSRGNATPLQVDEQVVALIETSNDAGSWRVSAIGNQALKDDLNAIRQAGFGGGDIAYFEVPNIEARIFAVTVDGQTRYLTNYGGFSVREPVAIETLLPQLKRDAAEFQRRYGDLLKEGKLVK